MKFKYRGVEFEGFKKPEHALLIEAVDFVFPGKGDVTNRKFTVEVSYNKTKRVRGRCYARWGEIRAVIMRVEDWNAMICTIVHELTHAFQFIRSGYHTFTPASHMPKLGPIQPTYIKKLAGYGITHSTITSNVKYYSNPIEMEAFHMAANFSSMVLGIHPMRTSDAYSTYHDMFGFNIEELEMF